MKRPIIVLLGVCACLFAVFLVLHPKKTVPSVFENEQEEYENGEEEESTSGVNKQLFMWFQSRAYPDPYNLNEKYMKGWEQAEAIRRKQASPASKMQVASWTSIGPNATIGGRMLCLAVSPANNQILFAGSASGGLWKSTDGATTWSRVTTGFPVLGVTSIIIDPSNANNIYVGTGEVYRTDSTSGGTGTPFPGNTGFSVWKTRGTYGVGILKSTDGGATWTQLMNRNTSQLFGIQSLRFDAANSAIIYAATTEGLYKSTNSGSTWTNILSLPYVSDVVANGNGANIVAAVGNFAHTKKGIYKSTNGGTSWAKIASALPASFQGFIRLDAVGNTVVASIGVAEASPSATCPTNCPNELYRSTDFGTTWTALANSGHTNWQYWCAHDVAINPSNTNSIVYGGVKWYNYTVGTGFTQITSGHDDLHDIAFDPVNNNNVYICCDGGIYKSTNGGSSFTAKNSGLNATQFYARLGVSQQTAGYIIGGLQDNYVYKTTNNGTSWTLVSNSVGDGAACDISPTTDNVVLYSGDARNVWSTTNGFSTAAAQELSYLGGPNDSRTGFVAPLQIAKSNSAVWYVGSDNWHRTANSGTTWTGGTGTPSTTYIDALNKPAITLEISPTDANKVYVSTSNFAQMNNDQDGIIMTGTPRVLKTLNGLTPFTPIMGTGANTLPNRFVMDFAIDPADDNIVFAAIGGFGTSHVYKTTDGGVNWTPVGTGLPDVPFNAVLLDPTNTNVLYAGGDMGVYVSPNRGGVWYDYNNGFPDNIAMVMDIQPSAADNKLVIATHGKGIFKGALYVPTLPVSLVSFTGEVLPAANELNWKVAQELGVSRYEIERSIDGTNFQKIGTVRAANSVSYAYTDASVYNSSYYYRLKIVDNDASFSYSEIVYLKRESRDAMQILSNPFVNDLKIQLSVAQNSKGQINLYDAEGKLLRSKSIALSSGQTIYTINDLTILPAGAYYVEAIVNNHQWRKKVIKK